MRSEAPTSASGRTLFDSQAAPPAGGRTAPAFSSRAPGAMDSLRAKLTSLRPGSPPQIDPTSLRTFIRDRLPPLRARLSGPAIEWFVGAAWNARAESLRETVLGIVPAALHEAEAALTQINERTRRLARDYVGAESDEARRPIVLEHLRETVSDTRARRKDERALALWLDLEALLDREARRANEAAHRLLVVLEIARHLGTDCEPGEQRALAQVGLFDACIDVVGSEHREDIRTAALDLLGAWMDRAGSEVDGLESESQRMTRVRVVELTDRLAGDRGAPRWVQIHALDALAATDPERCLARIHDRLLHRTARENDFLVRRNAMRVLGERLSARARTSDAVIALDDPSEHVRQELARTLGRLKEPAALDLLTELVQRDRSERVRGLALQVLLDQAQHEGATAVVVTAILRRLLREEQSGNVLHVAFHILPTLVGAGLVDAGSFVEELERLCSTSSEPQTAEEAAATLRALETLDTPGAASLSVRLKEFLATLREGERGLFEIDPAERDARIFARALRHAARGDLGVYARPVTRGYIIVRGEPRRRRLWRILHEVRNPAPDKRQGYAHTVGRAGAGPIFVPPIGMSEVTPTRVPGERRFQRDVGGWAPFLPRVDDLLDACTSGVPIELFTSAGVVTVTPPADRRARRRVRIALTRNYAHYADLRDASLAARETRDRKRFVEAANALGIGIAFDDEPGRVRGKPYRVELPFLGSFLQSHGFLLPPMFEEPLSYVFSDGGNSPVHLAVVAFGLFFFLLLRAIERKASINRALRNIPLTIGGWGTRGKSGSERLKAALFHALGYEVLVKTTGCEAMVIHGVPGRQANEIFIFRPYDKATIWEQADVAELAAGLHSQVFLWECMALRPRFVEILTHEWMRSDLTTITNAYPDHEDIQGPSGEDVARVIARFMPARGRAVTSEEQMLPLLRDQAAKSRTDLTVVDRMESDFLPADLLARFPYQEHPRNIAMVARLAEMLGVSRERALVEMADKVIADLGVLKTYPEVEYRGRRLQFSNGMSANERAGCLANWLRLRLDRHNPDREPDQSIVTVVNNRADRVPRSRVFARIVVEDLSADAHVCIGTNLNGLRQFIEEELDAWLRRTWVAEEDAPPVETASSWEEEGFNEGQARTFERFDDLMARMKIPRGGELALRDALVRMLAVLGKGETWTMELMGSVSLEPSGFDPDAVHTAIRNAIESEGTPTDKNDEILRKDVIASVARLCRRIGVVWRTRQIVVDAKTPQEANEAFRQAYRSLFLETVHIVHNTQSTGDQVIDAVAQTVAPGQRVHVLGIQNIKGTGLGFVYRWLSVGFVRGKLDQLNNDPASREETLTELASYADYGLIDSRDALRSLRLIAEREDPSWDAHREALGRVIHRLEEIERDFAERVSRTEAPSHVHRLLKLAEVWLDPMDAMFRRVRARQIVRELVAGRIGHVRAANLMRDITSRDKGGWLIKWWKQKFESAA